MSDSCSISHRRCSSGSINPVSRENHSQIFELSATLFNGLLSQKMMLGVQTAGSCQGIEEFTKNIYAIGSEKHSSGAVDASRSRGGSARAVADRPLLGTYVASAENHRVKSVNDFAKAGAHGETKHLSSKVPLQVHPARSSIVLSELHKKNAASSGTTSSTTSLCGTPGRSCAHCRTQKTPLWRNGPFGPKTLCNACGVRFKLGKLQVNAGGTCLVPSQAVAARKRSLAQRIPPKDLQTAKRPRPLPKAVYRRARTLDSDEDDDDEEEEEEEEEEKPKFSVEPYLTTLSEHDGALLLMRLAGVFS